MLKKLYYIFITGVAFFIFGFICMLGNLLFFPVVVFGLQRIKIVENFARDNVYFAWKIFILCAKFIGVIDYNLNVDCKNIKSSTLVIANHPSLLDIVFLMSNIKRANCVVKESLCKNIFLFPAIKACNYIPNSKNEELLAKSCEALKNGEVLVVFPEGTRSDNGIFFHKAASYIGIHSAKNIFQIAIKMYPKSLKKNQPWYVTPSEKLKYDIFEIGEIDILNFLNDRPNPIRARQLHKMIVQNYQKEFIDERVG